MTKAISVKELSVMQEAVSREFADVPVDTLLPWLLSGGRARCCDMPLIDHHALFRLAEARRIDDFIKLWKLAPTDLRGQGWVETLIVKQDDPRGSVDALINLFSTYPTSTDTQVALESVAMRAFPIPTRRASDSDAVPLAVIWLMDNRDRLTVNAKYLEFPQRGPEGLFLLE